jgi:Ca2+-transporting ATPase
MTVRTLYSAGESVGISADNGPDPGSRHDGGPDVTAVLTAATACNDSRIDDTRVIGDPMEGALLVLAARHGVTRSIVDAALPRLHEVPFDSAHKFMATIHRQGDGFVLYAKK